MIGLHLLRHAHAGDPAHWQGDDDQRPLSDRGVRQCERLGRVLAGLDEAPDLFVTSPRLRALQTAEIVAGRLDLPVTVDRRLAEPLDLHVISALLASTGARRPCLVGHDPDFSELLAALIGVGSITMRKGAIARVDVDGPRLVPGAGTLRYLLPPELVPNDR